MPAPTSSATPRPSFCADWPQERVIAAIKEISMIMKGPMSDLERACAHADRKELRGRLDSLTRGEQEKGETL